MKAALYKGNQTFSVEEIPTPKPNVNEVLIKVNLSAICGTDVHAFMYDLAPPETVLGHEFTGEVVEIGSNVTKLSIGDIVVGGGGTPPPGQELPQKVLPRYNYRKMGFVPEKTRAYAEYTLLPEWNPIKVPDGVSEKQAAMCEPTAVAIHAIRNSKLKLGDSVLVIGAGPIGLLTIQACAAAGADKIYVSEPSLTRQNLAKKLGATKVLSPSVNNIENEVVELTDGIGPDVIFDCAGFPQTLDLAFNTVRRNGQVILVAVPWEIIPLEPADWMAREISFKSSWGSDPINWHNALNLMKSGKIDIDMMTENNKYITLDKIQETFEGLMKPTDQGQIIIKF